ncbi:STAS domain-containing protein [Streptomyces fructofermentans]|uniref:STAS domain-containing protein n=1 Tax=Streptomyces fructofermentans TaxID=152141 RepID=UPI0037A25EBE
MELAGELDHRTAPQAHDALLALDLRPKQRLVLDLAAITFCYSSGLSVLIAARNLAPATDAAIALAMVPERVGRIIRIVGLDQVFPIHPTVQYAEDAWRSSTCPTATDLQKKAASARPMGLRPGAEATRSVSLLPGSAATSRDEDDRLADHRLLPHSRGWSRAGVDDGRRRPHAAQPTAAARAGCNSAGGRRRCGTTVEAVVVTAEVDPFSDLRGSRRAAVRWYVDA